MHACDAMQSSKYMAKGTQALAKKAAKRALDADRIAPAIAKSKGKVLPKSGGGGGQRDDSDDDDAAAGAGPGSTQTQQQSRVVYIG